MAGGGMCDAGGSPGRRGDAEALPDGTGAGLSGAKAGLGGAGILGGLAGCGYPALFGAP